MSIRWQNEFLRVILRTYTENPIRVKEALEDHRLIFENSGQIEGLAFIKIAQLVVDRFAEKQLRSRSRSLAKIGGTIEAAKIVELAYAMLAAGEITEDECVEMLVGVVTPQMIQALERTRSPLEMPQDVTGLELIIPIKQSQYIAAEEKFFFERSQRSDGQIPDIRLAAFIEYAFANEYFLPSKKRIKDCQTVAERRYAKDIRNSLAKTKEDARRKHCSNKVDGFPPIKNYFSD
ncbi:hypothetical protein [Niabella sp.]|uniref:hypothetical protein n=1 Tax=Niabella sp. TaxID=1962976 RepID=UPI00260AF1F8|nr:hypothetical protein [Niabella sp.]